MATVSREKNGTVRIWFVDSTGKRKGVRIGKVSDDDAERFKLRVEDLANAAALNRSPRPDVVQWVEGLSDEIQDRLARVGLVEIEQAEPEPSAPMLAAFIDDWVASRHDVKPATKQIYSRSRHYLIEFFGAERRLDSITRGDADEWALYLRANLNENTSRKMAAVAKLFFKRADRKGLIELNPFSDMRCNVTHDETGDFTVTPEIIQGCLAMAPDAEWRLIIALACYAGLRVPSEIYTLKWSAVDLERGRFTIRSPKTEHFAGKAFRVCPIFPELRPYFEEALLAVSANSGRIDGKRYVLETHRLKSGNLATQFRRIIRKTGLEPWPNLWRNCRASRQTELENTFPSHVVCSWLGNSPTVAHRHYLRVTESHFEQALTPGAQSGAIEAETVQNNRGQVRTNRDKVKDRNGSEPPVFPAKPIRNATPGNKRRGGVSCSHKDSNLEPND